MMAYIKPQYPLKSGENYIYPPTTADQVIMDNGQRLSGVGVYLDKPNEGEETTVVGLNADTLGGIAAGEYVLQDDLTTNLKALILDFAHPVGSYYWSRESTDPSVLFGGEWKPVKDKFILAAGDSYEIDATGGEAEHTLIEAELPSIDGAFAVPVVGSHASVGVSGHAYGKNFGEVGSENTISSGISGTSIHSGMQYGYGYRFGSNQSHNNMPPYLVAYCWYRTA